MDEVQLQLKLSKELREEALKASEMSGSPSLTQFVRDAIYEKITSLGVDIPAHYKSGRSRKGVGGPKKKARLRAVAEDPAQYSKKKRASNG